MRLPKTEEQRNRVMGGYGGSKRIWETGDDFEKAWIEYFNWAEENPMKKNDVVKSGQDAGKQIYTEIPKPLSIAGFAAYHFTTPKTVQNTRDYSEDHLRVFEWAKSICDAQRLEGAYAGNYNANLVARVLQIADKQETKVEGAKIEIMLPDNGR